MYHVGGVDSGFQLELLVNTSRLRIAHLLLSHSDRKGHSGICVVLFVILDGGRGLVAAGNQSLEELLVCLCPHTNRQLADVNGSFVDDFICASDL